MIPDLSLCVSPAEAPDIVEQRLDNGANVAHEMSLQQGHGGQTH